MEPEAVYVNFRIDFNGRAVEEVYAGSQPLSQTPALLPNRATQVPHPIVAFEGDKKEK